MNRVVVILITALYKKSPPDYINQNIKKGITQFCSDGVNFS